MLSYARGLRPDDPLVEVRPGVFAKRSNREGIVLNGRTVYYDVIPDQSFGPLRTGRLAAADVTLLARIDAGRALVLLYTQR